MTKRLAISKSLSSLARHVLGPSVVRHGVGDWYEDREPQRKYLIRVEAGPSLSMELVATPHRSAEKRLRLRRAVRAVLEAAATGAPPDWTHWHEGRSGWAGRAVHELGVKDVQIWTSDGGVTFLHAAACYVRFWGFPYAESAALAMVRSLKSPGAIDRCVQQHRRHELAEQRRKAEHERRMREDPAYRRQQEQQGRMWDGLFERDVQ